MSLIIHLESPTCYIAGLINGNIDSVNEFYYSFTFQFEASKFRKRFKSISSTYVRYRNNFIAIETMRCTVILHWIKPRWKKKENTGVMYLSHLTFVLMSLTHHCLILLLIVAFIFCYKRYHSGKGIIRSNRHQCLNGT